MLFAKPKGDYKYANDYARRSLAGGKWHRAYEATNIPDGGFFLDFPDGGGCILLSLDDLEATLRIDDEGIITYGYEFSEGDWMSFHTIAEVGEPFQHLFKGVSKVTKNLDQHPCVADVYQPTFLTNS